MQSVLWKASLFLGVTYLVGCITFASNHDRNVLHTAPIMVQLITELCSFFTTRFIGQKWFVFNLKRLNFWWCVGGCSVDTVFFWGEKREEKHEQTQEKVRRKRKKKL